MIPYLNAQIIDGAVLNDIRNADEQFVNRTNALRYDELQIEPTQLVERLRNGTVENQQEFGMIIDFLNQWGCRLAAEQVGPLLFAGLQNIIGSQQYQQLPNSLNEYVATYWTDLEWVFATLINIQGVGPTVASKVLSVLKPSLFMMWDRQIRKDYGMDNTVRGYCQFLEVMANYARQVLQINQDAENYVRAVRHTFQTPLAKSLDAWNRMKSQGL